MFSILPDRFSTISGHVQLWFLVLAVLVVLAQTSPDLFIKKCNYGRGRCQKSCKDNEKREENCGKYNVSASGSYHTLLKKARQVQNDRKPRRIMDTCKSRREAWEETDSSFDLEL
ncbi:beta-defensin 115 [Octodon degus]|uniref:Beta-defensin 115 n=1 Tax=Octodon degus TaxID=10160 RepID=A0A6P6EED7_OCTDE|nr:beta-defensin 115 [Octodon degus]